MPGMRNGTTPLLDTGLDGEETSARGWEGLAEWTGGLPPEQVEALAAVRELDAVYPLLHALVGRSPREFFVRAAVMEALVESARPSSPSGISTMRFLRASRSQFLLTAPTTLDRAQLDPAAMVIVLQKKRPGEPHAPVPIVAEA